MAAYRLNGERAAAPAVATSIDSLDAFARKLYRRARNASSNFENAATVVRDLHTVLKHLKVEAEDPESLLNSDNSALYMRQLTPIIEDTEFAFKQLDTILEKYFDGGSDTSGISGVSEHRGLVNDSDKGWTMLDSVELEKIDLIRGKLASQKLNIHMFLDTVQLHNPSKSRQLVDTSSTDLDAIKDKVDLIASRICQRKDSGFNESEDDQLWEQFRDALEEDGFSKDVLRKNQDVLRAYTRQVDEQFTAFGGRTPSVRGFLENYTPPANTDSTLPYPLYPTLTEPGEQDFDIRGIDDEKFFPSTRMEQLQNGHYPHKLARISTGGTDLSYDRHSSDDQDEPSSNPLALISTRDLISIDKDANIVTPMSNMHISPSIPRNYMVSSLQSQQYLPPSSSQPLLISSDRKLTSDGQYEYGRDRPPRHVPSLPPPPLGGDRNSPPIVHSNSVSAPSLVRERPALPPQAPSRDLANQRFARLGPDSHGREIPLDAKWTRIRRSLVSPEVLAREGLRYEARPDFVAILGELKKEEISDLARKSQEVRNERQRVAQSTPSAPTQTKPGGRERRPEDQYHPEKYRNCDAIGGQPDRYGSLGYVVNLQDPRPSNRSNSIASSTGELWDSSDDEKSEGFHESSAQYPSSYPPPSRPYHHFSPHSGSSQYDDSDSKGTKAYPFIVPSPTEKEKAGGSREKTSPAATAKPRPIKNKTDESPHVRFNPEPEIFDDNTASIPRSLGRDRRDISDKHYRDRDQDLDKVYYSDRYLRRDPERRNGSNASSEYYTTTSSRRGDHPEDYNNRDRYRDKGYYKDGGRGSRRRSPKTGSGTLRAVGIGGAAASLLSVLTEAAAGL
ncbi:hypothetical protein O1611_g3585 [Lasiodiplodia mahajangana]|uniref:Uncharacterized protein n=1 Tax=Lasiodiplodia mahajangana TaxID=1108764 RepID=A0ACC2JS10_9PEZI|nr:hypothetical protein O1611_g3585 [Lasiodiplodia mahajangana]